MAENYQSWSPSIISTASRKLHDLTAMTMSMGLKFFRQRKAPRQIGLWIGGGVELRAQWTQKAEVSLRDLAGDAKEVGDEPGDLDVVSKHPEFFRGIALSHGGGLLWKPEFGHGVGYEVFVDFVQVLGGGVEEASGSDIVDEPRDGGNRCPWWVAQAVAGVVERGDRGGCAWAFPEVLGERVRPPFSR